MKNLLAGICVLTALLWFKLGETCNEAVCASIVSKCMITQSCKCDPPLYQKKNCSCCKECYNCLSHLYTECCSCVEMCPKPNYTTNALSKKSHVEELQEPLPNLFTELTSEPDIQKRWTTYTFPVDFDISHYNPALEKEIKYRTQSVEQEVEPINMVTLNCSVAYITQCMSWNKCRNSCQSMGASSYRWFHDGCCECVGEKCINYGINESRCADCPVEEELYIKEEDADYGDEDEMQT